jgi:hypothetical protein
VQVLDGELGVHACLFHDYLDQGGTNIVPVGILVLVLKQVQATSGCRSQRVQDARCRHDLVLDVTSLLSEGNHVVGVLCGANALSVDSRRLSDRTGS